MEGWSFRLSLDVQVISERELSSYLGDQRRLLGRHDVLFGPWRMVGWGSAEMRGRDSTWRQWLHWTRQQRWGQQGAQRGSTLLRRLQTSHMTTSNLFPTPILLPEQCLLILKVSEDATPSNKLPDFSPHSIVRGGPGGEFGDTQAFCYQSTHHTIMEAPTESASKIHGWTHDSNLVKQITASHWSV